MRISQKWVKRLEIHNMLHGERKYILIETRNGFRFSGYLDEGVEKIPLPPSPLFT